MAAAYGYGAGYGRRRRFSGGLVFTDDLTDGATTPVAITTSFAPRQAWQKGATVPLAYNYDLAGGDPTGFAVRIGGKSWVALENEVITPGAGDTGSGTGAFVPPWYAQGTLEVKPINGLNVTPASVANITSTDIFVVAGQSGALGNGGVLQAYTKTNFDLTTFEEVGGFAVKTGDPWITGASGSRWPRLAERLDQAGIPPVFVKGDCANGVNLHTAYAFPVGPNYLGFITEVDLAATKGFKAILWDQGQSDTNQTGYAANLEATLDGWQSTALNMTGVPLFTIVFGESSIAGDLENNVVRSQQRLAYETYADIFPGPNQIGFELADDIHVGSGTDPEASAQINIEGDMWWRCLSAQFYGGADPILSPQIIAAQVGETATLAINEVLITFDRAMQNHTDLTGWRIVDATGVVPLASAVAATVNVANDSVLITASRAFDAQTDVSFAYGLNAAKGATLTDIGTIVDFFPEWTQDFDAGIAVLAPTAPVNTVQPVISGTTAFGSVLSVTDGTWTGNPAPTITYQWRRDSVDIAGATANTHTLVGADVGANIDCIVTGTNATAAIDAFAAAVGPVTEASPVNTVLPAITGTLEVGQLLTCSTGTWTSGTAPTYTYQWQRDTVNISGATSSTYTTVGADDGATLTCEVTATNTNGGTMAESAGVVIGINYPDIIFAGGEDGFAVAAETATQWQDVAKTTAADTTGDPVSIIEDAVGVSGIEITRFADDTDRPTLTDVSGVWHWNYDGTSDHMDNDPASTLDFSDANGEWSAGCVFQVDNTTGLKSLMMADDADAIAHVLRVNGTKVDAILFDSVSGTATTTHQTVLSANTWYRAIAVVSGNQMVIYVDGVIADTIASVANSPKTANPANYYTGQYRGGTPVRLPGKIAGQFHINRELTAAEITGMDDWLASLVA